MRNPYIEIDLPEERQEDFGMVDNPFSHMDQGGFGEMGREIPDTNISKNHEGHGNTSANVSHSTHNVSRANKSKSFIIFSEKNKGRRSEIQKFEKVKPTTHDSHALMRPHYQTGYEGEF